MRVQVVERDKTIYLVLEYGEIDLATILARKERQRAAEQEGLDENFIRLAWQSMLQVSFFLPRDAAFVVTEDCLPLRLDGRPSDI